MGLFIFLIWTSVTLFSLLTNRDIFSPVKLYMFALFIYFANIFVTEYSTAVTLAYLTMCLLGAILSVQESQLVKRLSGLKRLIEDPAVSQKRLPMYGLGVTFWIISIPPLLAQFWLIRTMGGVESYINNLGMRVIEFRGLGALTTIINVFPVINLVYFAVGLINRRTSSTWWLVYAAHFGMFVLIGLASGSRGALLNNIIFMLLAYHYLNKRVSIPLASVVAVGILLCASLIGVARNGYRYGTYGIETGLASAEDLLEISHFKYGIEPIDLVYSREPDELQLGMTFLTIVLNPIPRAWWPEKPDTGGVVLTKQYTGDAWDGASNLSTGMIAEGVINFGWVLGTIAGLLILWVAMHYTIMIYGRLMRELKNGVRLRTMRFALSYGFIVMMSTGLVCGEFTNILLSSALTRIIPLWCIAWAVTKLVEVYRSDRKTLRFQSHRPLRQASSLEKTTQIRAL